MRIQLFTLHWRVNSTFTVKNVQKIVNEARCELGLLIKPNPQITDTYYDRETNSLLIVVADRPDKSMIIGPGGQVIIQVMKRLDLSEITVNAKVDVEIKKLRIKLSIKRLQEIKKTRLISPIIRTAIDRYLMPLLKTELRYPRTKRVEFKSSERSLMVVALSGGVDSWAATMLAQKTGLNPTALTIDPGSWLITNEIKKMIDHLTSKYEVKHRYISEMQNRYKEIFSEGLNGKRNPCGKCHKLTEKIMFKIALEKGVPLISFGDLLPTGNYSAYLVTNNLLRFNIPAALSLSKIDTINIAKQFSHLGTTFTYGCPMLREILKKHEHLRHPSTLRVIRETRAGILEPGYALKYIKSIEIG